MNLAQAESGIGATVAYVPTLETGRIAGVNERYVFVNFAGVVMACHPVDVIWYYGPVMAQIIRRVITMEGSEWQTLPQASKSVE